MCCPDSTERTGPNPEFGTEDPGFTWEFGEASVYPSAQAQRLSSTEQSAAVTEERTERRRDGPWRDRDIQNWGGEEEMEEETSKGGREP